MIFALHNSGFTISIVEKMIVRLQVKKPNAGIKRDTWLLKISETLSSLTTQFDRIPAVISVSSIRAASIWLSESVLCLRQILRADIWLELTLFVFLFPTHTAQRCTQTPQKHTVCKTLTCNVHISYECWVRVRVSRSICDRLCFFAAVKYLC